MQHGLCLPSCRLSSEHTTRLRGDSRIEKGRLEGTGPRPPRPRSSIRARSGGCLSQKTSALHPGHEQHEERGATVANEVWGTILRVKYLVYFTTHKTAPLGATKSWKSIVNVLNMLDVVSSEARFYEWNIGSLKVSGKPDQKLLIWNDHDTSFCHSATNAN